MPELAELSGPHNHEDLPGLGQQLQDFIDHPRIIVGDRDGGLVLGQWRVAQKTLIDSREQEGRIGKQLLPILARKYRRGAGDRHDEVRLGTIREGGSDVVDDRLFRRDDKPCRADDDLNDVHGSLGDLVQVDAEVAGEIVERHVAAIERLQHQDLSDRWLSFARRRTEQQPERQRGTVRICGQAISVSTYSRCVHKGESVRHNRCVAPRIGMIPPRSRCMTLVIAAVLALLCAPASASAQPTGEVVRFDLRPDRCPAARRSPDDSRASPIMMAHTSASGDFAFRDLPEGDYEISAELSGFERARRAVRVQAGERVTVSFTLRVAIVEETIVTAARMGARDVQAIPMAITAVSNAELARLGTRDAG